MNTHLRTPIASILGYIALTFISVGLFAKSEEPRAQAWKGTPQEVFSEALTQKLNSIGVSSLQFQKSNSPHLGVIDLNGSIPAGRPLTRIEEGVRSDRQNFLSKLHNHLLDLVANTKVGDPRTPDWMRRESQQTYTMMLYVVGNAKNRISDTSDIQKGENRKIKTESSISLYTNFLNQFPHDFAPSQDGTSTNAMPSAITSQATEQAPEQPRDLKEHFK